MSDFKVVLPRTTEEWQRDMNIAYQQGRADVWADIEKIIDNMSNPIQTMEIIIKQLKEQNK